MDDDDQHTKDNNNDDNDEDDELMQIDIPIHTISKPTITTTTTVCPTIDPFVTGWDDEAIDRCLNLALDSHYVEDDDNIPRNNFFGKDDRLEELEFEPVVTKRRMEDGRDVNVTVGEDGVVMVVTNNNNNNVENDNGNDNGKDVPLSTLEPLQSKKGAEVGGSTIVPKPALTEKIVDGTMIPTVVMERTEETAMDTIGSYGTNTTASDPGGMDVAPSPMKKPKTTNVGVPMVTTTNTTTSNKNNTTGNNNEETFIATWKPNEISMPRWAAVDSPSFPSVSTSSSETKERS